MDSRILDIVSSYRTMRPCVYIQYMFHMYDTPVSCYGNSPTSPPRWDTGRRVFPQQSLSLQEKPWLPFLEKTYGITDGHNNYISWWQPSGLENSDQRFRTQVIFSRFLHTRWVAELHLHRGAKNRLPLKSPAPWAKGEGSILYAHLCILKHNAPWYPNFRTKNWKAL